MSAAAEDNLRISKDADPSIFNAKSRKSSFFSILRSPFQQGNKVSSQRNSPTSWLKASSYDTILLTPKKESNDDLVQESESATDAVIKGILKSQLQNSMVETKLKPVLAEARADLVQKWLLDMETYRSSGGREPVIKLIGPDALAIYSMHEDQETLENISDEELLDWIRDFHGMLNGKSMNTIFANIKMSSSCSMVERIPVETYSSTFMRKARLDGTSILLNDEKEVVKTFVSGIYPSGFRKFLRDKEHKEMKPLLLEVSKQLKRADEAAKFFEDMGIDMGIIQPGTSNTAAKSILPNTKPPAPYFNQKIQKQVAAANTPTAALDLDSLPQGLCYNCGRPGHIAKACRNKHSKYCYKCMDVHKFDYDKCMNMHSGIQKGKAAAANIPDVPDNTTDHHNLLETQEELRLLRELLRTKEVRKNNVWVDSGANRTFIHSHLNSSTPILPLSKNDESGVLAANGEVSPIVGTGSLVVDGDFVPNFENSLVSVSQLCREKDASCIFDDIEMHGIRRTPYVISALNKIKNHAFENNLICISAKQREGLYTTSMDTLRKNNFIVAENHAGAAFYATAEFPDLKQLVRFFHESWRHADADLMCSIVHNNSFDNLPKQLTERAIRKHFPHCESCAFGNMARKALVQKGIPKEREIFEIGEAWEVDLKGPWTNPDGQIQNTFCDCQYLFSAVCVNSGKKFQMLLKNRQLLHRTIEHLLRFVQKEKRTLKVIFSDDEFVQTALGSVYDTNDIDIRPCPPYEHDVGIGRVERWNRTVDENVNKALYGKETTLGPNHWRYWGLAALHIGAMDDMLPKAHLGNKSPDSLWFKNKKPDLLHMPMFPFGTPIMSHIPVQLQTALSGNSFITYFIGVTQGHNQAIRVRNPATGMIMVRRSFKTLGNVRPDQTSVPIPEMYDNYLNDVIDHEYTEEVPTLGMDVSNISMAKAVHLPSFDNGGKERERIVVNNGYVQQSIDNGANCSLPMAKKLTISTGEVQGVQAQGVPALSSRDRRAQCRQGVRNETGFGDTTFDDDNAPSALVAEQNRRARTRAGTKQAKAANRLPRCYAQAMKNEKKWGPPTTSEFQSFLSNDAWKLPDIEVNLIPSADIFPSMLHYDEKFHPDGTHNKDKCRMVIRGDVFADRYQTDNYAGTVRPASVKILLAVAAELDYELESVDAKTAFLNSPIEDGCVIYMRRPPGVPDSLMPPVVQLKKYIYGLPEASKKFREHSDRTLRDLDFKPTVSDNCVYTKLLKDGKYAYVMVHVDDFGIVAPTKADMNAIKSGLAKVYNLVCTPDLKFYLGLNIQRDRANRSITINQCGYHNEFLLNYGIIPSSTTKFPSTPMMTQDENAEADIIELPILPPELITLYQSKVGSVNYLACNTRPDILFATTMASRKNQAPTAKDMVAIDRVLWYIAGTRELGLRFHSGEGIVMYVTVDAAYANHKDRKSHSAVTMHIGRKSASFNSISKKQTITADSSTVAEFIGTHTAAKEIMWARMFMDEIGFPQLQPTILFEDNKSTIALIERPGNGQKTKHIDIRYNFIREQVLKKVIVMEHLGTKDMTSDALTKALAKAPFLYLRSKLLGMSAKKLRSHLYEELRPVNMDISAKQLRSCVYKTLAGSRH